MRRSATTRIALPTMSAKISTPLRARTFSIPSIRMVCARSGPRQLQSGGPATAHSMAYAAVKQQSRTNAADASLSRDKPMNQPTPTSASVAG